jgi:ornithine cyclodeaminase/alanine dehydrogenase-like protein (mu-crystallin family)
MFVGSSGIRPTIREGVPREPPMSVAMTERHGGELLLFGADDVRRLGLEALIESQRRAFLALDDGTAQLGPRVILAGERDSVVFSYAARMSTSAAPAAKFGSVVPDNRDRGLPVVSAIVVALDPVTGRPRAIAEGEAVTEARTVAASILAATTLAGSTSNVAVLGCGRQGRRHAAAAIRHLAPSALTLWSPHDPSLEQLSAELRETADVTVRTSDSAARAVRDADVVFSCTTSKTPVIERSWLRSGATVISIGSFAADRCEVGDDIVTSARLVVDHVPSAIVQAGPIVKALAGGSVQPADLHALGAVLAGRTPARTSGDEVVYYNSIGLGIQDAAVMDELLARAGEQGWGRPLEL